ncbi:MAG: hypothetical protein ACR2HB_00300, partial [Dehalococcoidia bacterium]
MENAVTISPGATLTAEAGVAIAANDGSSAIVVQGTFNVNGASGHRVSLTKTDTGQNWGGVEFAPGSGGSLSFMQLSFAVARCASGSQ